MKKQIIYVAVVATALSFYSCKNSESIENASTETVSESKSSSVIDSTTVPSSSAAIVKKGEKNIIRKADINFEVKNAIQSTQKIEDAVTHLGGIVSFTNLQSNIVDNDEQKISSDSVLKTVKYNVENTMTLRVPNTKLDTVVKQILKEVSFLNNRKIEAEDVTLQIIANTMAQKRKQEVSNKMRHAIDKKDSKLNQTLQAEDKVDATKEALDTYTLNNLDLKNQTEMSTITLHFYQPETFTQTIIPQAKSLNYYRPHIGTQIFESIKTGWYTLEDSIAFIVKLWSVILLAFLGWLAYKKGSVWLKKQTL
ncbi:uncharacterized protein DUF4349 [Flavobacterium croceum DSM 17960]|uniref:Uncharacterized protein DUF4349 n=1 Tax=Flavobacterium croceum DSM 17960 TaxID=1121886 RepID=A0A2S4NAK3_9FLAO|nr:DUF4349 domain-containing protein [Flavobacterium croceum]POS02724.1 uncharacterized protein DUF4349 [Flavobacterium croceum DSM 17960]